MGQFVGIAALQVFDLGFCAPLPVSVIGLMQVDLTHKGLMSGEVEAGGQFIGQGTSQTSYATF